jgi:hypothetical protein
VNTDAQGQFQINDLPAGTYQLAAMHHRMVNAVYSKVIVASGQGDEPLAITLRSNPRTEKLPPVVVTAADIPTYPAAALANGISGAVSLRLSVNQQNPSGDGFLADVDAVGQEQLLIRAAREHVLSWRFGSVEGAVLVRVTYGFRLLPGDCSSDQRPVISIKFPSSVEVTAKRRIPCGALDRRSAGSRGPILLSQRFARFS